MTLIKTLLVWAITMLPTYPRFNKWRVSVRRFFGEPIAASSRLYWNARTKGKVIIGEHCNFNENVMMASTHPGKITIGNYVIVGPNVVMRNANHIYGDIEKPIRYQGKQALDILIEDDVWIASNVVVLPGAIIRKGSVIGAGAIVRGEIPPYSVAVGIPARVVKRRGGAGTGTEPSPESEGEHIVIG
jgi:acetyltransferase-like isoleucine patch superfamily enzyme